MVSFSPELEFIRVISCYIFTCLMPSSTLIYLFRKSSLATRYARASVVDRETPATQCTNTRPRPLTAAWMNSTLGSRCAAMSAVRTRLCSPAER